MIDRLFLPILVVLVALTGFVTVRSFLPRGARWNPATLFAALTLGIMITGWLALLLAELEVFGPGTLAAVLVVWLVGMWIWQRVSPKRAVTGDDRPGDERLVVWEWIMLTGWLVVALWLFMRPHEYVYGGADAGVYISLGAEIAQHGGFRIDDATLAEMTPDMQAAVLRPLPNTPGASSYLLPGFYVTNV